MSNEQIVEDLVARLRALGLRSRSHRTQRRGP